MPKCMNLKYEPSSSPLHISVKQGVGCGGCMVQGAIRPSTRVKSAQSNGGEVDGLVLQSSIGVTKDKSVNKRSLA